MIKLREHLRYELPQDLFAARVRGGRPELVVNWGYEGLVVLGCAERSQSEVTPYPHDDFAIYSWVMAPQGDHSYLFGGEQSDGALRVDHVAGTTSSLSLPAGAPMTELAWFADAFSVLDYAGALWTLREGAFQPASEPETEACLNYFYRRLLSHYVVVKADPYQRGVYVRSKEFARKTIGFMPFDANQPPLLAEQDGTAVDTTRFGEALFVSFEKEVLVQEDGELRQLLTADEDELWVRINVVERKSQAYLTLISSSEDHLNPARGSVIIYEILTE
jgi:hypothetical protein